MPTSDGQNKADRLYRLQKLFEQKGQRLRTGEIAKRLGVSEDTTKRDIDELSTSRRLPLYKDGQFWMVVEDARVEQLRVHLSLAEATALYVAGRLLSQIHDERNRHVILALTQLIDALPEQLRHHQSTLVRMAELRQHEQDDRSSIFEALAIGWTTQRKVRILYKAPRKNKFSSLFSPYLLEPSGIGRTIYALGMSEPPDKFYTFKLERIESATVTDETFTIPENFDGPARLARSWGVMYGEDPITVRLRFSEYVRQRVQETLWHPSQQITSTREGCEWTAQIGETLEIENWIRGWGADCEVLEPHDLREKIAQDVRRAARLYGITSQTPSSASADDNTLFDTFFGEE